MGIPYDTKLPPDLRALKEEIEGYARGYGLDFYETIFEVIDAEDLIDVHATAIRRREEVSRYEFKEKEEDNPKLTRFKSKDYMDNYINPPGALKAEEAEQRKQTEESQRTFPEHPEKDVLLFLIGH